MVFRAADKTPSKAWIPRACGIGLSLIKHWNLGSDARTKTLALALALAEALAFPFLALEMRGKRIKTRLKDCAFTACRAWVKVLTLASAAL